MLKFVLGLMLIGGGFLLTIFLHPVWGLYTFAALSHIRLEQLGESIALPLRVPIVIAATTLLVYMFGTAYREKFSRWPAEIWLFGLMVLGMAAGAATAEFDKPLAWTLTLDMFKYWVFFVMLIQMLDSERKMDGFYWVMILSAAWLVYRAYDLRGTTGFRFENLGGGNVADSNHFSAALVLLFPFVFHRTFSKDWRIAAGAAVLCFGIVMAIIIAISRGGMLGLVALAILIVLISPGRRFRILLVIGSIGVIALSFATEDQLARLAGVVGAATGENRDDSAASRLEYWALAWQLFKEHYLVGVGPGNFMYYSGPLLGREFGVPGQVTHSLWFEILSQGGLVVFVPFVLMLLRFFRNSFRLSRIYAAAGRRDVALYIQVPAVGLAAFLVSATFLDRTVYEPIYWCIGLGVVHRYLWGAGQALPDYEAEQAIGEPQGRAA